MPFEDQFNDIYHLGIKAVATECEVVAERVDEQSFSETILERIYRQIESADFIIADMTGRNPNVFYEVGYAHARGKICTLLTQSADDIPFDLKHHRHIVYNGSIQSLKTKLKFEIEWLKEELEKQNTNPFTIELNRARGELIKKDYLAHAEIELIFDIHNKTKKKSPEIEAIYLHTSKDWTFKQSADECPSAPREGGSAGIRHFIKSPVPRLASGAWAQVKLKGEKLVWTRWSGEEIKEKYPMSGFISLEIYTSSGVFREQMNLNLEIEEVPF